MASRPVEKLGGNWIDGELIEQKQVGAGRVASLLADQAGEDIESQIEALAKKGDMSMTAIVRAVWGSGAGEAFYDRSELVKRVMNRTQEVVGT